MEVIDTFIIDAFTDIPFKGNPAGVCFIKGRPLLVEEMMAIAAELNLSETAFITRAEEKGNRFTIRYFTPTVEIEFCGHATFAAARMLIDQFAFNSIQFSTFGKLELFVENRGDRIAIRFPTYATQSHPANNALLKAMGVNNVVSIRIATELSMLLIELLNKDELENLTPDFSQMVRATPQVKEVVVTTVSRDQKYDFYSRCFCPWIGINEDPVTGAAHCILGPYWQLKLNKNNLKAFQCSARGGYMDLSIDEGSMEVVSNARIILRGSICLE